MVEGVFVNSIPTARLSDPDLAEGDSRCHATLPTELEVTVIVPICM